MTGKEGILQQAGALFMPERCILCGRLLLYREHHCCSSCISTLEPTGESCRHCGGIVEENQCLICGDRKWYPARNVALYEYNRPLKELLYHFKARQKKRLHHHLGTLAAARLRDESFLNRIDIIVPVPVSAKRRRQRGYNQARLLALETSKEWSIGIKEVLKRVTQKEHQKNMSYARRFLNVPGCFAVKRGADIAGRSILLVDDVLTTGATINECARVLKAAGAGDIFSVTLARAPIKRLEK